MFELGLVLALLASVEWPPLDNAGFEHASETESLPQGWQLRLRHTTATLDPAWSRSGNFSLRIEATRAGGLAVVTQALEAADYRDQSVEVRLHYHTGSLEKLIGGFYVNALRGEENLQRIMSGDYLEGGEGWQSVSLRTVIPPAADRLKLELIAWFKASDTEPILGSVWFDDVELVPLGDGELARGAELYLEGALDRIERHAVHGDRVDWSTARENARSLAAGALEPGDTHAAIRYVLSLLDDGHSGLASPEAARRRKQSVDAVPEGEVPVPGGRMLEEGVALLEIPPFGYQDPSMERHYATTAHRLLRDLDRSGACGWIVDIRENRGGNSTPMVASVAPLLGDGVVGHFAITGGEAGDTVIRDGQLVDAQGQAKVPLERPYRLDDPDAPVAVLLSPRTASSGEMTAIKFLGRPVTRTFGQPTAGQISGNLAIPLDDGAVLKIAAGYPEDRKGRRYTGPIQPDVVVPPNAGNGQGDPVLQEALAWLRGDPRCGAQQ